MASAGLATCLGHFRTNYELVWECLSEIPATFFSGAASLMISFQLQKSPVESQLRMLSHDLSIPHAECDQWTRHGLAGFEFSMTRQCSGMVLDSLDQIRSSIASDFLVFASA